MLKVNEWTKLYQTNSKQEPRNSYNNIRKKITFKIETIIRDKEEYVIMIKGYFRKT